MLDFFRYSMGHTILAMICDCGSTKTERNGKCASCNRLERKAAAILPSDNNSPINKRSKKLAEVERKYFARIRVWKRGKKCEAHFKHDCDGTITVQHLFGRGTHFHDEWAEENQIELTRDERFWKPMCLTSHRYVTDHPKFAHEHGYAYLRLAEVVAMTKEEHDKITKL